MLVKCTEKLLNEFDWPVNYCSQWEVMYSVVDMVYSNKKNNILMGVLMRKTSILFMTIVISLLSIIVTAYSDEATTGKPPEQQTQQKNECILLAIKCGNSIISIQDKIQLLKEEIAKGRAVYSLEELNNLRNKLDEVNKTLDFLLDK